MSLTLTHDQEEALVTIKTFLLSDEKEMVLSGNSGSGKSTLIKYLLDNLRAFLQPARILKGDSFELRPYLTATTNEAATVLSRASGQEALTVHKHFGLRFKKNFKTGQLDLVTSNAKTYSNSIIVVDEASMCNLDLREKINMLTCDNSKIIYVGDNEQLETIKSECDIFTSNLLEAHLTTNVRQAGNEIAALGLRFRDAVLNGKLPVLDGISTDYIKYIDGQEFMDLIDDKFSKDNFNESRRILAYSNDRVIEYNNHIREIQNGTTGYVSGERLFTNNAITQGDLMIANNNTVVHITDVQAENYQGMEGYSMKVHGSEATARGFVPNDPDEAKRMLKSLAKRKDWSNMFALQDKILDLRPRFASTCHKAQGGTLDEVFIDLNDIGRCWDNKTKARLLYVGITRAKAKVYLYGSL